MSSNFEGILAQIGAKPTARVSAHTSFGKLLPCFKDVEHYEGNGVKISVSSS